jgi:hypothetical protein
MTTAPLEKDDAKAGKARRDGLLLLLLGAVVFVLFGVALENSATAPAADFRALYYPARTLVYNSDPYLVSQVEPIYQADRANFPGDNWKSLQIATQNVYPPTAFTFMFPFAVLPWGPAHILWIIFTVAGILFVSGLIWKIGADHSAIASGALIGLFLLNSELLVISANAAGIVVSLCVVAVICFLRNRFVLLGVVCLAISLTIKPQETGLVWLYFLLAGGVLRRYAWQTLLAAVAISLPSVLWVWHVSPHWLQEWRVNLAAFSAHGAMNDPGPASSGGHGLAMVISLQAILSVIRDDPHFYNLGSDLICMPLVLVWGFITLRRRASVSRAWVALASIAAITMLPVYHRQYDSKLLLLTVPACVLLWAEGGLIGRLAILINTAAFVLTGDLTWAMLLGVISRLPLPASGIGETIRTALQMFPAPLILLVTGVFYLWVYARGSGEHPAAEPVIDGSSQPLA